MLGCACCGTVLAARGGGNEGDGDLSAGARNALNGGAALPAARAAEPRSVAGAAVACPLSADRPLPAAGAAFTDGTPFLDGAPLLLRDDFPDIGVTS
ncbi:hypothetical protein GCM10028783_29950 [Modestobacter muralis]